MIIGMMRIKNEARWIDRVLTSMLPLCEQIFVLDDHSTDNTRKICETFSAVTLYESLFEGVNEVRDKNWLIEKVEVEVKAGDWILAIDGDEELEAGSQDELRRLADGGGGPTSFSFKVVYLWDRMDQARVDRLYDNFWRPSFFRLNPGERYRSATGGGFHCGNVPQPGHVERCRVRILHMGYLYKEDRIRKWHFYNSIDPINVNEGYDDRYPERRTYPHIVQGDVPEVPAEAVLTHAGPLRFRAL